MRRLALLAVFALASSMGGFGQEHGSTPGAQPSAAENPRDRAVEPEGNLELWKWANFVILAGLLGWLISKHAPAFFRSRTEEIQRGIAEATKLRQEAEARAASMESRMASLQGEIDRVRAASAVEMAKEAERLRQETEKHLTRMQAHGEQEIAAAAKHAQNDLRAYSAQLAIQLAEQRIRGRMSADTQNALVAGFIRQLENRPRNGAGQ